MAMVLLYGYLTEREAPRRWTYLSVFGVNTVFLLATGNRGGFVLFFLGVALFFWSFRKELGAGRIVRLVLTGTACMAMAAFIVLNFTRFNVMFDRLAGTEFESAVVPDTRVGVWEDSWEAILEAPITGHGPKLALGPAGSYVAGMQQISFPHSLPLYILYTTGVIGLLAYAGFFGALAVRLGRRLRRVPQSMDPAVAGIPRLSFIIFLLFCASQLRIEMLRTGLVDYQHFVFMLFGVLLGLCDHVAKLAGAQRTAPTVGISAVPAAAER
jgi:O-antigen ligase